MSQYTQKTTHARAVIRRKVSTISLRIRHTGLYPRVLNLSNALVPFWYGDGNREFFNEVKNRSPTANLSEPGPHGTITTNIYFGRYPLLPIRGLLLDGRFRGGIKMDTNTFTLMIVAVILIVVVALLAMAIRIAN
jgi:hypothetical protein